MKYAYKISILQADYFTLYQCLNTRDGWHLFQNPWVLENEPLRSIQHNSPQRWLEGSPNCAKKPKNSPNRYAPAATSHHQGSHKQAHLFAHVSYRLWRLQQKRTMTYPHIWLQTHGGFVKSNKTNLRNYKPKVVSPDSLANSPGPSQPHHRPRSNFPTCGLWTNGSFRTGALWSSAKTSMTGADGQKTSESYHVDNQKYHFLVSLLRGDKNSSVERTKENYTTQEEMHNCITYTAQLVWGSSKQDSIDPWLEAMGYPTTSRGYGFNPFGKTIVKFHHIPK